MLAGSGSLRQAAGHSAGRILRLPCGAGFAPATTDQRLDLFENPKIPENIEHTRFLASLSVSLHPTTLSGA